MQISQFLPFIIAILLGALLGFERAFAAREDDQPGQKPADPVGGVRTYSLICLFGCLASFLNAEYQHGILIAAFIGTMLLTVVAYYISFSRKDEAGITTEISILISFIIGIAVQHGHFILAAFITVLVMMVLHLKRTVLSLTKKIQYEDISAVVKFGIITLVILPLMDPGYALYVRDLALQCLPVGEKLAGIRIITPHNVWLMVVLISGISFTGYIAMKVLGPEKGIGLTGILGGFASSTATTLTFSRRSAEEKELSRAFALAVLLACSIMFPRMLIEVLIVNSALLPRLSLTLGLMAVSGFVFCAFLWKKSGRSSGGTVTLGNPFDISSALKFGLLYAIIVFITRIAGEFAGSRGVYFVSLLSGLTDVDSIVLTMSQLALEDPSRSGQATTAITLAAFSNTLMKAVFASTLGSPGLRKIVVAGFACIIAGGVVPLVIQLLTR